MAKVKFKRIANSSQIDDLPIEDGSFVITGDGKSYIDYGNSRVPTNGTLDDEMDNTSRNGVENKVIKEYVDNTKQEAIDYVTPVVLFESTNGTSSTVTLSDDKSNYEYIEILGRTNGNSPISFKVKTTLNNFDLSAIDYNLDLRTGIMWGKVARYTFNSSSLVPTKMQWINMTDNTGGSQTSGFNIFYIYKVLGYK